MQKNNYASSDFKRIAHRGASAEAPENTLPAIARAVEKHQVDMVEIDLRLTKDRIPVVIHDETLERTTNGEGPIHQYSLRELKTKDAGFRFDPEGKGLFPYREKGVTIPTLEEVLGRFPETSFCLEVKEKDPACVREILTVIERIPRKGPLIIGSFHASIARELRQLSPASIETFFSRDEVLRTYLAFRLGFKKFSPPARYASLPRKELCLKLDDEKWISFLHRAGVSVFYWTVDAASEMEILIERGADGIVTNYPNRLNEILVRLKRPIK